MKSNDVISNGADFFDILGVLAFCQLNREMGVGEKCAITRALSHLYWVARPCNSDVRQLSTIKFRYGEADAQGRETAGNDACCCFQASESFLCGFKCGARDSSLFYKCIVLRTSQ